MMTYKVVETSQVEDSVLENLLNEWSAQGWIFERMQFAMSESSRRPVMAFLFFVREVTPSP